MVMKVGESIAKALEAYFDANRRDGYFVDGVTGREAAAVVTAALVDRVKELHSRLRPASDYCICGGYWPCSTLEALGID